MAVQLTIKMNASGTGTTLEDVVVIGNPSIGSVSAVKPDVLLWLGMALVVLVLLAGLVIAVAVKKTRHKKA